MSDRIRSSAGRVPPASARRRGGRGYSIIEVMMGMAVLAVGASGVVALQKVTVFGVTNGRNINAATAVAAAHVEAVRADSVRWNSLGDYTTDAVLMNQVLPGGNAVGAWVMPASGLLGTDPGFGRSDITGDTDVFTAGRPPIAYCTQMRLTPVAFDPLAGNALAASAVLMRLEVRTFWAKSGRDVDEECLVANLPQIDLGLAGSPMTIGGLARTADEYGWVFLSTSVRRNDIVLL